MRKGKYEIANYFEITCKKESDTKQILYVKADGEICGALSIHPNIPAYQKKIKVVFVKVTTDINGVPVEGSSIDGEKEFLYKILNRLWLFLIL